MARRTVKDHWFVSFEAPDQLRLASPYKLARQTETFPTETDAKRFAKEMLSEKPDLEEHHIVAGTFLNAYLPVRRIFSGSQLCSWVGVEDRRVQQARAASSRHRD
jgi:hypothetical protein